LRGLLSRDYHGTTPREASSDIKALQQLLLVTPYAHLRTLPIDRLYTPVVLTLMVWTVLTFPPKAFTPFIYAQF